MRRVVEFQRVPRVSGVAFSLLYARRLYTRGHSRVCTLQRLNPPAPAGPKAEASTHTRSLCTAGLGQFQRTLDADFLGTHQARPLVDCEDKTRLLPGQQPLTSPCAPSWVEV